MKLATDEDFKRCKHLVFETCPFCDLKFNSLQNLDNIREMLKRVQYSEGLGICENMSIEKAIDEVSNAIFMKREDDSVKLESPGAGISNVS